SAPTLAFPVDGVGERAIGSPFGVPRDGGARSHHGIDIFAPRGTPVIAGVAGTVNRVNETAIGGLVVWLRDEARGQSLYYAHLDEQRVASGQRVRAGDTLGTVGNTGNARSKPPHLHFGIYRRGEGPVDPFHFVHTPPRTPPSLRADTALLGGIARTARSTALRGDAARDIPAGTVIDVVGARSGEYRVALPDGSNGWVDAAAVQVATPASATTRLAAGCAVRDRPRPDAAVMAEGASAADVVVLGAFGRYTLVRTDILTGWTDCA
ncbi:MAG TPA: M23 family metallopeptidase, partial [Longimicrobiales bacterium]|nr:M23 family metallopeptidase [Longimicrobiales bacterium]